MGARKCSPSKSLRSENEGATESAKTNLLNAMKIS